MTGRARIRRDPFEGTGAYRHRIRLQGEGFVAFALAIIACGITAALWIRTFAPVVGLIS